MAGKRRVTGRALKFLFASGILRGKGSGKNRTTTYDKGRAQTIARNRKRGVDVTKRASRTNKSGRFVFGGSKAAGLRSGSGSGKRDFSGTRAERIAAGREKAAQVLANASPTGTTTRRFFVQQGQVSRVRRDVAQQGLDAAARQVRAKSGLRNGPVDAPAIREARLKLARDLTMLPKGQRRPLLQKAARAGLKETRKQRIENALALAGKKLYSDSFTGGRPGKTQGVKDVQRRAYAALKRKQEAARKKYGS